MGDYTSMLESVSRTFALSIKVLPRKLRDPVGLAYLLFRVSDCLEDHPQIDATRKVELLELWVRVLNGDNPVSEFVNCISDLDNNDPEVQVAYKAESLMNCLGTLPDALQKIIVDRCARSTSGMARWQRKGPVIETEDDLDDYMHQVAGRVGYLMTDIYAWYLPHFRKHKDTLLPISREIGLGLQSVNVVRGLRLDYGRGWFFIPSTYLDQAGITREQFFTSGYEEKALFTVNLLIKKAERHLHHGLQYIYAFPRYLHRIRLSGIWPLFFAIKTLAKSRNNPQVVLSEVKISRQEVKTIVRNTSLMGWSNSWLRRYYETLSH
jgi:farnesyl-diphosphate farnesyltransferase